VHVIADNFDTILHGFAQTLQLTLLSALVAGLLGLTLAVMRVSPLPPLRWVGTGYVTIVRNTPLTLVFLIVVHGLPELGLRGSFFTRAVVALSAYTAAFVCEAVRSGIQTVPAGQAEAARALGMTFGQNLRFVVLPQALRAVIPPLTSVFIALLKNTAIAEAFGLTEATGVLDSLVHDHADALLPIFLTIAAGYVLLTLTISGLARLVERRTVLSR
jgi:glutamate transport system permease protein